jgi:pyruvate dehydrogenase E1 component alpha subunit
VEEYKQRDPIQQVRTTILKNKHASEEDLKKIDKRVEDVVAASVKFAEESPWPDDSEVLKDVVKQVDYPFIVD